MINFPSSPTNNQIEILAGNSYIYNSTKGAWQVNGAPGVDAQIESKLSSPTPIGNTAANAGAFSTLSASGALSGVGFSDYFASPPTLGNTTPNTGKFSQVELIAGTAALAPFKLNAGALLTAAIAGAFEFASADSMIYFTPNATNGRGFVPVESMFNLEANLAATAVTISPFFGANSAIPLVANGLYEIEFFCLFLKNTAGTLVWTLTNSAVVTNMAIQGEMSPIVGSGTTGTWGAPLSMSLPTRTAAVNALPATGSLTTAVNHYAMFRVILQNASSTSLRLNVTNSLGTITPLRGSYWKARRIDTTGVTAA